MSAPGRRRGRSTAGYVPLTVAAAAAVVTGRLPRVGTAAAGGLGLVGAPLHQQAPARSLALLGVAVELGVFERMKKRMGLTAEPYSSGTAGRLIRTGELLALAGTAGAVLGRRHRMASALSGAALLAASATTRLDVFQAGLASARDPRYTVEPQRERVRRARVGRQTAEKEASWSWS